MTKAPSIIIAIDGTLASGKGTLAKGLAADYGLPHLDTGLLYRAVGKACMDTGTDPDDAFHASELASGLNLDELNPDELRTAEVGQYASRVAVHPPVRKALFELQRGFAFQPGGAVLDGRDIGSVVLPDAPVKFFVDADIEVRAERRTNELQAAGQSVMFRDVLADMQARDERDRGRSIAPLRAVEDAKLIDTSSLDADQVFASALAHIDAAGT